MTDLKTLQEAAKLIDSYPSIIDVIRNSPNESQRAITKKMTDQYTNIGFLKVLKQLVNVGLVDELKTIKKHELKYEVNEVLIRMVELFAKKFAEQIQK